MMRFLVVLIAMLPSDRKITDYLAVAIIWIKKKVASKNHTNLVVVMCHNWKKVREEIFFLSFYDAKRARHALTHFANMCAFVFADRRKTEFVHTVKALGTFNTGLRGFLYAFILYTHTLALAHSIVFNVYMYAFFACPVSLHCCFDEFNLQKWANVTVYGNTHTNDVSERCRFSRNQ